MSTFQPSPVAVPGYDKLGLFYRYRDTIRVIYEARFQGALAHLKDLCDFTTSSPLFGCRPKKTEEGLIWKRYRYLNDIRKSSNYEHFLMYAYSHLKYTYQKKDCWAEEPVTREQSEWLTAFIHMINEVWNGNNSLRRYYWKTETKRYDVSTIRPTSLRSALVSRKYSIPNIQANGYTVSQSERIFVPLTDQEIRNFWSESSRLFDGVFVTSGIPGGIYAQDAFYDVHFIQNDVDQYLAESTVRQKAVLQVAGKSEYEFVKRNRPSSAKTYRPRGWREHAWPIIQAYCSCLQGGATQCTVTPQSVLEAMEDEADDFFIKIVRGTSDEGERTIRIGDYKTVNYHTYETAIGEMHKLYSESNRDNAPGNVPE